MQRKLISELRCPYCNGGMRLAREVAGDAERLHYGLLACRCFEFPVVDGILLLSLAKGYGGAEEELQPYVPLQVAAIRHLQKDDVNGLKAWIKRHLPLASELIEGTQEAYLPFAARMAMAADKVTAEYLIDHSRFEFLGYPPSPSRMDRWLGRMEFYRKRQRSKMQAAQANLRSWELQQLLSYYPARFFAPRVNALALQLGSLPLQGRILSLCCGHGVFENLLNLLGAAQDTVSCDGQFLNLLVTRRYAHPQGNFICHDLQFPFPFKDGAFDGVFASTCLPEIPAQKSFVSEAVRVTSASGWAFMDSVWNLDIGVKRIDPLREYRFCQNFFTSIEDYLPFFEECSPGRELALDVPKLPQQYRGRAPWVFGRDAMLAAMKSGEDWEISMLATTNGSFRGLRDPGPRTWLTPQTLAVSPAYDVASVDASSLVLKRRASFDKLQRVFAPKALAALPESVKLERDRLNNAEYLMEQYCAGVLTALPREFDRQSARLADLR